MNRPRDTTVNASWVSALAEALSIPVSEDGADGVADIRDTGAPQPTRVDEQRNDGSRASAVAVVAADR